VIEWISLVHRLSRLHFRIEKKKTHCTNATFLGLSTACKSAKLKNQKKVCVSLWAFLDGVVDERERELCLSSDGAEMW